jgi:hypothetical protein
MKKYLFLITILVFALASNIHALVITNGCADPSKCTMAELFAGGTITVNDKLFDNWNIDEIPTQIDLSQIVILGLDSQPLNPGIHYAAGAGGQELYFTTGEVFGMAFSYTVEALDEKFLIKDNSLGFSGGGSVGEENPYGEASITERVEDQNGNVLGNKEVWATLDFNDGFEFDFEDSIIFAPQSLLHIFTELYIDSETANNVLISSFTQHFSQEASIPEPSTLLLLGAGLAGVGLFRRRFKK